jgi:hypothetical protein
MAVEVSQHAPNSAVKVYGLSEEKLNYWHLRAGS